MAGSKNDLKKVLIITYYWPPSGGIGVLRCLKISKYLRDFGWEPIIYTAKNAHYPTIDHSNDKDLVEGLKVIKGRIWEPYSLYKWFNGLKPTSNVNNVFYTQQKKIGLRHKLSVWIRSNFFIPDARAFWIKPSVKNIMNFLSEHKVDAIFSNGPPHSNTRIATLIKQKTGIPWLADFQDPWSQVDYFKLLNLTKHGLKKHLELEQEVFKAADKITIVSNTWKNDLEGIGATNVGVVPWGYDPHDYQVFINKEVSKDKLIICHLGILGYDRNPSNLFRAIKILSDENPRFKDRFCLRLVGQVDVSVKNEIENLGIQEMVDFVGLVDRNRALSLASESQVLLLLLNQQDNAKGRIPGKLFEYLALRNRILCLGEVNGDSANIIEECKAGRSIDYNDYKAIYKELSQSFDRFENNEFEKNILENFEKYSVIKMTEKIANYLNDIVKSN